MTIHTTPVIIGQGLDVVDTTKNNDLGTRVRTNDGGEAVYVTLLMLYLLTLLLTAVVQAKK